MTTERELVKLPSGVSLEAKLHSPETSTSSGSVGLAALPHPWSWLGGQMEDRREPSLITLVRVAQAHRLMGYNASSR